ncbi:uncharacterized protein cubi_01202 [Cryptosporidium ubiquitum]|uniref:Condensin complex subunit 2 n=1 Tax=Cryptosporidium ubiquitum TaxID=857276 RepID=A0A1J4MJH6_9CRYT|nr:uncharacterized protein cubi_01202 [Cryptosporidium ubiquitum]OII74358.1 hypothetical protein cubi_01202 [Cryptosporidium ubiquitum]
MGRLSLHPRKFESEYSAEINNFREENASSLNNNCRSGRKIQKSILPNKRRSISIGQGKNDEFGATKLSRTSINLKGQIEQNKLLYSKSSSNQLPNEDLDQLCNQCLNLLRQNKISSKNAFDILLIDHLNDIVNVQDPQDHPQSFECRDKSITIKRGNKENSESNYSVNEKKNSDKIKIDRVETLNELGPQASQDSNFQKFQRAAVTLEASARIYGYRVDSTFDNAYRILSNIKSGQILARNDSDCEEDQKEDDSGDILAEGELNRKKKNKKNLIFSGENNTVVSNPELITLKEFEKTKEISEKPFFVNFLNDKIKLDNIGFGVDCGNIGSISSMLMNNLELRDSVSNKDNSVSFSFNISGKNSFTNRNNSSNSKLHLDQLLKVNKKTLDLFLPNPDESFSQDCHNIVCPDLTKILDSIQDIIETHNDIKQVKDSVSLEEQLLVSEFEDNFLDFSKLSIENKVSELEDKLLEQDQSVCENENDDPSFLSMNNSLGEVNTNIDVELQSFQIHVERVIEDLKRNEFFDEILDEDLNLNQETEQTKKSEEFKFNKIGDVLDFLANKSSRSGELFNGSRRRERNNYGHGQKLNSKSEEVIFEIPSTLLTNSVFNGIEWVNSLPKTVQTPANSSKTKVKSLLSNKTFVGESNTSSIFNYDLGHLFCLANLTGVKINLRSIHNNVKSEDLNQDFTTKELLIKANHSQLTDKNVLIDSMPIQTDLMASHCEIEDLMQAKDYLQPSSQKDFYTDSNKDIFIQTKLILPFDGNDISETDILLEKSSKSLHVKEEYSNSLKFSKSSNNVDIDLVKRVLKDSIQLLLSKNSNHLTLFNIINQSRKLLQQEGINSVSTGIFFICILHICNENNYSLSFSEPNINSDTPIELNSENYNHIMLNLDSSVDLQK